MMLLSFIKGKNILSILFGCLQCAVWLAFSEMYTYKVWVFLLILSASSSTSDFIYVRCCLCNTEYFAFLQYTEHSKLVNHASTTEQNKMKRTIWGGMVDTDTYIHWSEWANFIYRESLYLRSVSFAISFYVLCVHT